MRSVESNLRDDSFLLCYDADRMSPDAIRRTIEALGFRPREAGPEEMRRGGAERPPAALPGPVAAALERARAAGRALLLEFHAPWCAPCIALEDRVLSHAAVREILERDYLLVRINDDESPEVSRHYDVDALPTLLLLDSLGAEAQRVVGVMEPADLARDLAAWRAAGGAVE